MPVPTLGAVEALEAAVRWITAHPEHHDQTTWWSGTIDETMTPAGETPGGNSLYPGIETLDDVISCGTSCCVAGTLALQQGRSLFKPGAISSTVYVDDGETYIDIEDWGVRFLGIPAMWVTHYHPFDANRTLSDLQSFTGWYRHCYTEGLDAASVMRRWRSTPAQQLPSWLTWGRIVGASVTG